MQNRSRADEADAGNDLRSDARVIAEVLDRERIGKNGEQRRAKADEHIGAQAGGRCLSSRSRPMTPPRTAANTRRTMEVPTIPLAISPCSRSRICCQFMSRCNVRKASDGRILSSRLRRRLLRVNPPDYRVSLWQRT